MKSKKMKGRVSQETLLELVMELNTYDLNRDVQLNRYTYISDASKFVNAHYMMLADKSNERLNSGFYSYYSHLLGLLNFLKDENK